MGKFLIGLILGVGIAIGVVYYLNNSQTQLVNKFNNVQESSVNGQPALLSPGTKIKEVIGTRNNGSVDESDYDFYQILQNKDDSSAPTASTLNKKVVSTNYVVQVGSFADMSAAKDMKARLAFLGYEAKISNVQKATGVVNQVLIGPYTSEADAKSTQQDLSSSGVKTIVVKLN